MTEGIGKCRDCGRVLYGMGNCFSNWAYEGDHLYCKGCLETRIVRGGDPYLVQQMTSVGACGIRRAYKWDGYDDFVRRIHAETGDGNINVGVSVCDLAVSDRVCLYKVDERIGEISEIVQYYNAVNGHTIITECLDAGCATIGPAERRKMDAIKNARMAMNFITGPVTKEYLTKMLKDDSKESE